MARLQQMSANQHERLVSETAEKRTARLKSLRDRLAIETAEERMARLQQMSANQHERLVSETAEERTARLQSLRDRLAFETAEERMARICCSFLVSSSGVSAVFQSCLAFKTALPARRSMLSISIIMLLLTSFLTPARCF